MQLFIHGHNELSSTAVHRVCFNGEIYAFIQRLWYKKCWLWFVVKQVSLSSGRVTWSVDSKPLGESKDEALVALKSEIVLNTIN